MIVRRVQASILVAVVVAAVVARAAEAGPEPRVVETVHEPPAVAVEGVLPYRTTYRLWIPAGQGPLRALVVHQHGCGKGASDGSRTGIDDLQWQALAREWRCGLLVPTYETTDGDDCRAWCDPRRGSDAAFLAALERLADAAGCPEVATIPWCLWGHSGGAFWATIMLERHPDRVVAVWLRSGSPFPALEKGEIPPLDFPEAAFRVPIACNPGLLERGDARFAAAWTGAIQTLDLFRSRGAPVMFAPDPRTGHECGESRALAIPFFARMLAERLPDVAGSPGPLAPLLMDEALAAPLDDDDVPGEPRPFATVTAGKARCGWLPDASFAARWREYVRDGHVVDETPPPPPRDLRATPQADGTWRVDWRADADPESGLAGFSVRSAGREIARLPEKTASGGRTFFQGISYHDTPLGPTPPMAVNVASPDAGGTIEVVAWNAAGLASAPARVDIDAPDSGGTGR